MVSVFPAIRRMVAKVARVVPRRPTTTHPSSPPPYSAVPSATPYHGTSSANVPSPTAPSVASSSAQPVAEGDHYNLYRFIPKQLKTMQLAISEIEAGHKMTHWIWWILPTFVYLVNGIENGSIRNKFFAIRSEEEGVAYLRCSFLRDNYAQMLRAVIYQLSSGSTLEDLFQDDHVKALSSFILFERLSGLAGDGELRELCQQVLRLLKGSRRVTFVQRSIAAPAAANADPHNISRFYNRSRMTEQDALDMKAGRKLSNPISWILPTFNSNRKFSIRSDEEGVAYLRDIFLRDNYTRVLRKVIYILSAGNTLEDLFQRDSEKALRSFILFEHLSGLAGNDAVQEMCRQVIRLQAGFARSLRSKTTPQPCR